jgi:predicted RNA-binding protein (virulence factor B family)
LLNAQKLGLVFLPEKELPRYSEIGDKVQVFLYYNSSDELVATTKRPRVELGGIACLKVLSVNHIGAFLDWGLPKDLFVPFGEQSKKMQVDELHIVKVYEDNTGRICGSSKLNKFIKQESQGLKTGQEVRLMVGEQTDLGCKMIVNQSFWGVLHHADIFRELRYGQNLKGYIKKVREDKRLDISLKTPGHVENESLAKKIFKQIEKDEGLCAINDKSPPELIYKTFGVSKKVYKAELGKLYKQRKIVIEKNGIRLADKN